jgi:hypothetical protein
VETRKNTAGTEICVELIEGLCLNSLKGLNEGAFVSSSAIVKFGFRIRTRGGLIVDNLLIHGRDEVDAERKLRQMYQHCKILECKVHQPVKSLQLAAAR